MNSGQHFVEEKRLAALQSYHILDSQPEDEYDDLTALASQICETPISLVSLVDKDRQWFKSHHGIDVEETPREVSFCSHAIKNPDQPMIVQDLRMDERFSKNPLVTGEPFVIFYAGIPLVDPDGLALGSLCVIDHTPRQLGEKQVFALRVLARQVVRLLNARKLRYSLNNAESFFEERLQSLLTSQTQELTEANQSLSKLNQKAWNNNAALKKSNLDLQQFAYMAAHDLQEPIRKIGGFADLATKHQSGQPGAAGEYIRKIKTTAQRMSGLVNNLLDLSKAEQTNSVSTVSLDDVMQMVLQDLELVIEESGATLKLDPLPSIKGDETHFCQLFQNLIANSLKFKRPDVPIEIQVRYKKMSKSEAPDAAREAGICDYYHLISVIDNGIGFDQHKAKEIFLPFHRLQNSGEFPGTGIGLAICQKVVATYGGTIAAEGSTNEGAEFSIYFPCVED